MTKSLQAAPSASVDPQEIAKFGQMAAQFWDPKGPFAPLHALNPCRLRFIKDSVLRHFARQERLKRPYEGLSMLDVGCGGGLVCEPLARLGASVTGVDGAAEAIEAARLHADQSGLAIAYRAASAEDLVAECARFDVVLALEVVEHVADVNAFGQALVSLLAPGGLLIVSTINRTPQARALAIFAAERILGWAAPGTHEYDKFVRPDELAAALSGLIVEGPYGMRFDPMDRVWRMGGGASINYFMLGRR
jgi:2-polyprenyl-6-hydroxyphenyl methylase/3-demethylubiquinone-9 3-methyltransferase